MTQVTVNGNTYSDDGSTPKDMNNGGFRQHQLPMIIDTMVDTAGKVAAATHQAEIALAAADAAAVSASTAVSGPGSNGTSTTSLTIALGAQSLVIEAGKTLAPGMPCTIASTASPRNWMNGSIDSYNPGTGALQVYVTNIGLVTPGVYPTLAAWSISLSGPAAQTGVLNALKGDPVASAASVNLDAATGNYVHLTGSVGPIAAITLAQGAEREVTFDGTPILVHSATLDLPTKANIQAQVGDVARFRGEGGGVVKVTSWTRASGRPLVAPGSVEMTTSGTFNPVPGASYYFIDLVAGGASGNAGISNWAAGGGGGERIQRVIPASAVSAPVTVLVGSGGLPVTVTNGGQVVGNDGSNTAFGNLVVAHAGKAPGGVYNGGSGGGVTTVTAFGTGQVGAGGGEFNGCAEWGGASGGGVSQQYLAPSVGGSSLYGGAGGGAVAVPQVPGAMAGGKSGATYVVGGGGAPGTGASRNGGKGNDAATIATSGDGGGASYYTGANNVGGDGGFPGGGGGGAISSSGTATSGAGKPGVARIYWW
jgi:hypothetical protein